MTFAVKHFPTRVRPYIDELLDDWFWRLEIQNHHAESVWTILLQEGLGYQMELNKLNFVEDPDLLDFLAYLARLERDELGAFPYRDYSEILSLAGKLGNRSENTHQGWVRFIDKNSCFCPLCLQETRYIRKYWHLGFVAICSKHKLWLVTRCLYCGNEWKWRNVLLNQCPYCQSEATVFREDMRVEDTFLVLAHQYLDEIFNQKSNFESSSMPLDKSHRFFLLFGISELVSKVSAEWTYHLHHRSSTTDLEFCSPKRLSNFLNYATAFQAIDQWPNGFYRFLDHYRLRKSKQEQRGLNHEFGPLYSTWIKNRWADINFDVVQQAFKTYLEHEFIPYEQFKKADFARNHPSILIKLLLC
jgi:hypothetical protein